MLNRRSLGPLSALMCALALALGACGSSPTANSGSSQEASGLAKHAAEVYQRLNQLTGKEREKELVKLAEEEGALSIYTSNTDIDGLIEGFEDTYDIDVSVYRGDSESVLQRVLEESRAHFYGNDVFETNALELDIANQEGLLYPYQSDLRSKIRPQAEADTWVGTRLNVFVVSYNTDNVKPEELPDSIVGFADPKWKDRISMELEDVDWFQTMHDYLVSQGRSSQEATDVFRRIAANAKIVKGHTPQAELLAAGQYDVALSTYSHSVDELTDEGAPVTWRPPTGEPVQPIVTRPNGVGLMRTATNPAAAVLFADYELKQGQDFFADEFRIGAIPDGTDPLAGLQTISVDTKPLLAENEPWTGLYEDVVRSGDVIKTDE
jgi:iron(III) transport system substrate-binding protein